MKLESKGFGTVAVIASLAGIAVVASVVYFNMQPKEDIRKEKAEAMIEEGEEMMEEGEEMMEEGEEMMEESEEAVEPDESDSAMMEEEGLEEVIKAAYTGKRISGSEETPLLEYNKEDYERALKNGDKIALFFYANWCPLCKLEFPKMKSAFDELDDHDLVGFRVHFKDGDADDDHDNLAREHGVAYQHTKVLIKDGERVLKSPETWKKDDYISNLTAI